MCSTWLVEHSTTPKRSNGFLSGPVLECIRRPKRGAFEIPKFAKPAEMTGASAGCRAVDFWNCRAFVHDQTPTNPARASTRGTKPMSANQMADQNQQHQSGGVGQKRTEPRFGTGTTNGFRPRRPWRHKRASSGPLSWILRVVRTKLTRSRPVGRSSFIPSDVFSFFCTCEGDSPCLTSSLKIVSALMLVGPHHCWRVELRHHSALRCVSH